MNLSIEDKLQLEELPSRYADYVDDHTWDKMDEIFTEDAVFEFTSLGIKLNGLEEIKAFLSGLVDQGQAPQGHLMLGIYSDASETGAKVRFRAIFPRENTAADDSTAVFHHASYFDDLVKTDRGWRVKDRQVTIGARN